MTIHRLLWVLLATVLFAMFGVRGLAHVRTATREVNDQLVDIRNRQAEARWLDSVSGMLPDTLAARTASLVALAPLLLDGRTAREAGEVLRAWIEREAVRAGVTLDHLGLVPDVAKDPFVHIGVGLTAHADLSAIVSLLSAVETAPELLSVEAFGIENTRLDSVSQELRISMTVRGWALPPSPL